MLRSLETLYVFLNKLGRSTISGKDNLRKMWASDVACEAERKWDVIESSIASGIAVFT